MRLAQFGWSGYWQAQWNAEPRDGMLAARVTAQQKKLYRLAGEFGECWAEPAGKMFFEAEAGGELPATGDWVAASYRAEENRATMHEVLPRRTKFSRQAAGNRTGEQVIAANVDTVFVVTSLNQDLNARRIERYLALVWESGARPVVLLTKSDLCADTTAAQEEVERAAMGVPVHAISAARGAGIEAIRAYFGEGQTVALVGSSGAGKSTLVNYLLGAEVQRVREIREGDDRGRHATTARELFLLPDGGLILDTPGIRELQLWDAGEGLEQTFADIVELAAQCRFRDCTHASEPGCAVQAALADGSLDAARRESLQKLEREQQFQLRKMDVNARIAEQKRWKKLHQQVKDLYELRRREGREK